MLKSLVVASGLALSLSAHAQNATCADTNAVITSVGRNFFVVNGGVTVNDHVWYSRATKFSFVGVPAVFPSTGELMDFVGIADPVAGCVASAITIKAAPQLSCTPAKSATASTGKGTVTAVGTNYIVIGGAYVNFAACTNTRFGKGLTAPAMGSAATWRGYVETNGNVMAQSLTFK